MATANSRMDAPGWRDSSASTIGERHPQLQDQLVRKTSDELKNARRHIGLNPHAPALTTWEGAPQDLLWSRIRLTLREPFLEFWGVFIMVLFGNGAVAQVTLSAGETSAPGGNGYGNYQSVCWGWALGVMLGIYVAGDSGAYLNPAITLANTLFRRLPARRLPSYILAQCLGGFCASAVVYAVYRPSINRFEGGAGIRTVPPNATATAQLFCTYPQTWLSTGEMFVSDFVASAVLCFVVFAFKDENGADLKGTSFFPLALLFLIFGLGSSLGWQTGYATNPARDFPPRLMSYLLGYGTKVWSAGNYYFWIPIVSPFAGCLCGAFCYDVFVYTGRSPVNTPWLGAKGVLRAGETVRRREERERGEGVV